MLKNLVKYLIIIVSIAAILGTIVYFLKKYGRIKENKRALVWMKKQSGCHRRGVNELEIHNNEVSSCKREAIPWN